MDGEGLSARRDALRLLGLHFRSESAAPVIRGVNVFPSEVERVLGLSARVEIVARGSIPRSKGKALRVLDRREL